MNTEPQRIVVQQLRRELSKMAGRIDSIRGELAAAISAQSPIGMMFDPDPHGTLRADLAECSTDLVGWADVLGSLLETR